jgi:hypothetical protein
MDAVTISIIIGALLAMSEALSLIPAVRVNGLFQMAWNVLKIAAGAKKEED